MRILIIGLSILVLFIFGCHDTSVDFEDLCPGCTSNAKLNNTNWDLNPYLCTFVDISGTGDSLFSLTIDSSVPQDDYFDALYFGGIPFKEDSISLPDANGSSGLRVYFNVYEYEYDVQRDHYEVVPGSGSYVKVETANHETRAFNIVFNLVLAVNGDTTMPVRNHTYPSVLNITDGRAEVVVH